MYTLTTKFHKRAQVWLVALLTIASLAVAHGSALAQSRPAYTQPELDRMLAPIALYPDPLLSQIFMASTYPIEVVEAARWTRANPGLQGDAAVRAVENQDWDPSVKSLVAFPDVLVRMDENLEWTRELGDAFLVQEPQVMETVQRLRQQARMAGTLASDARIRVVDDGPTIVVQPVDPRVIYVPYYDPRVAYGTWWWPAYPPVVWAPWPGYAVRHPHPRPEVAVGFIWGPAVRVSVGFFFGAIDWPRREVRVVTVNNYYYRPVIVRRDVHVHRHVTHVNVAPGPWRHDPWHRRGVSYRDPDVQQRYAPAAAPRDARRTDERRRNAAPAPPESRAAMVRPDQGAQTDRSSPRSNERAGARPDDARQDRRTERRQPENATSRTTIPEAGTRAGTGAAPIARDAPGRASQREQRRPEAGSPRPVAPSPAVNFPAAPGRAVNAPSVDRDARRGDARETTTRQERRTAVRAPTVPEQSQRGDARENNARQERRTAVRAPAVPEQSQRGDARENNARQERRTAVRASTVPEQSQRGDARENNARQDRRAVARVPEVRDQPQRDTRARPEPRQAPEAQVERPRQPRQSRQSRKDEAS